MASVELDTSSFSDIPNFTTIIRRADDATEYESDTVTGELNDEIPTTSVVLTPRSTIYSLPDEQLADGLELPIMSFDELAEIAEHGDVEDLKLWSHSIGEKYPQLMVLALRADKPETVKYLSTLEGAEEALPGYQLLYDTEYVLSDVEWKGLTAILECTIAELLTTAVLYEASENIVLAIRRAQALNGITDGQLYELFNLSIDNHNYHAYDALLQYAKLSVGEKPIWVRIPGDVGNDTKSAGSTGYTGSNDKFGRPIRSTESINETIINVNKPVEIRSTPVVKMPTDTTFVSGEPEEEAKLPYSLNALLSTSDTFEDDTKDIGKYRGIVTDAPVGISHDQLIATVTDYIAQRNKTTPLEDDSVAALNFVKASVQSGTVDSKIVLGPLPPTASVNTAGGSADATDGRASIYSRDEVIRQLALSQDKKLVQIAGPVNIMLEIIGNDQDECARMGGCHMLTCRHMNDEDDGDTFEVVEVGGTTTGSGRRAVKTGSDVGAGDDWFTGCCDICGTAIPDRRWALRMALLEGGWQGCFDGREKCLRTAIRQQSRTKEEIARLDEISDNTMKQLLEFGILPQ